MAVVKKKKEVAESCYELAKARIAHAFDIFDTIAVSFSGGKDSTIVLNLALDEARKRGRLPLDVFHFDEEIYPDEVTDYLLRVRANPEISFRWYCLPVKHSNACSSTEPFWYPWAPEKKHLWCREMPEGAITELGGIDWNNPDKRIPIPELNGLLHDPSKAGQVGTLLGIRADESLTRYKAVARRVDANYINHNAGGYGGTSSVSNGNVWKVYPIYDWTTLDVWTAPAMFGWDYCRYYDLLEMAGVMPNAQRLAPPFGQEPFQSLWIWARISPELWAKMTRRVDGVNTGAIYSKSILYAFGKPPDKPDNLSWPDFVSQEIKANHKDAKNQELTFKRIDQFISLHNRKAGFAPIAVKAEHPDSGISWNFLLKIAIRGDFKHRKLPKFSDKVSMRRKYDAEMLGLNNGTDDMGTRY